MAAVLLAILQFCARHGRVVLVLGLVAGIALPEVAALLKPWLPEMVAALLFIAGLRIGMRQAAGSLRDLQTGLVVVLALQLVVPMVLVGAFLAAGFSGPVVTGIVLMAAASSISGAPNLTILSGHDPAPALRVLVIGTAVLPLTVVPVFAGLGALDVAWAAGLVDISTASVRLLVLILGAAGAAFLVRPMFFPDPSAETVEALDGLSALAMAVVVVGLMSAVGPALWRSPGHVISVLAVVCVANFGLQVLSFVCLPAVGLHSGRVAHAIIAGNRNVALFLAALPAAVTDPLLLFIGCYQVPMYLTPLVMKRLYGRA